MSPLRRTSFLLVVALCTLVPSTVLAQDDHDADLDDAGAQVASAPQIKGVARAEIERELASLLADPKLGFCKDPDVARAEANSTTCDLAHAQARMRCPALEIACRSTSPASAPTPPPARLKKTDEGTPLSLPSPLGTLLFWGLLFLLAVFVARMLLSLFDRVAIAPAPGPAKSAKEGAPTEAKRPHEPHESDVDRLLARAETERKQRRFEAAIGTLHAALVHKLGQDELVTVDAARTNGDYLRELARRPELQSSVRQVFRAVERTQFGRSEPSEEVCQDVLSRILPIVKRGVALLFLLVLLPTGTSACKSHRPSSAELSPQGLYLMTELLKQNGTQVRRRAGVSAKFDDDVKAVLVLGDDVSSEVWANVLAWAEVGGSVYAVHPPESLYRELAVTLADAPSCSHPLVLNPPGELEVIGVGRRRLHFDQAVPSSVNIDASCDNQPYIATFPYGEGTVTLLENPELLSNASLSVGDNAAFVVSLLGAPGFTLELVDEWTGGGESSPVRALQNAGMRPLLLEVLVFMAVLIWRYGSAFGTRRDPSAPARRAFVDHVWALGRCYARARASRHALGLYAAFALEQLRVRFGRGAPLGLIDLAGELARRTGQREQDVMRLLTEAHEAAQDRELERGSPNDLDTLHKLETLLYPSGGTP